MNPLARLAFPALRWRGRTGFRHERSRIEATLRLGVGGYVLFGGPAAAVRELTVELNAASPHPLLIGSDLERGAAQQFRGLTHLPPPGALGFVNQPDITARCGVITAREARHVGVNWVYAPVADLDLEAENPIIGTRSFGDEPEAVGRHVGAWVRAAEQAGVVTSVKHYPGHGRTALDSHETLPAVHTGFEELAAFDLAPFEAAITAGTRSVMTAHVAYPAWDPSGLPATVSPLVLGHLRERMGFQGLVVTDALIMEGVLRGAGEAAASVRAIAAGADALLYTVEPAAVVAALERETASVARARLDDALQRVTSAAEGVRSPAAPLPETELVEHRTFADATADLAVHILRGERLGLVPPLSLHLVDDDVGGPYVVGARDVVHAGLREAGVPLGPRGSKVVLVYAEPRSWKGRASLGDRSLRTIARHRNDTALIVLFGHPRLANQLPGETPVVCAWHGQPLMQLAAARWIAARLG